MELMGDPGIVDPYLAGKYVIFKGTAECPVCDQGDGVHILGVHLHPHHQAERKEVNVILDVVCETCGSYALAFTQHKGETRMTVWIPE